jgi:response regulator RpfG family c-di-GMP phosphodiesterase
MFTPNNDDEIIFADDNHDDEDNHKQTNKGLWKILIVDDEEQIHAVTKMALRGVTYDNKQLHYISAYSSKEAKEILSYEDDIALILLDVVMESDDAGLELSKYIRKEMNNNLSRIILRTGQPGQAPEKNVILDYDINDYKNKSELTSQGLFTAVISALRSYQDIHSLHASKIGLEEIIKATSSILEERSFQTFIKGVLIQIAAMMKNSSSAMYCTSLSSESNYLEQMKTISCIGNFEGMEGQFFKEIVGSEKVDEITGMLEMKKNPTFLKSYVGYFKSINNKDNLIYIELDRELLDFEVRVLDLFMSNVSVALDNVELINEVKSNQVEILNTMGNLSENHSKETGYHIKRVTEYTYLLCKLSGMAEDECELVKEASAIHDIGKLVVPDEILNKPAKLTNEEFEIIKTHASVGGDLLSSCKGKILQLGGIIAGQHHEKYNGKGYPKGLSGEDIHIYGRVVAIADVFDALSHKRCYKDSWSREKIEELFKSESGESFDPTLVELFLNNLDRFYEIKSNFSDNLK